MAAKKSTTKRNRRTPEEMMADLQAKIEKIKNRKATEVFRKHPIVGKVRLGLTALRGAGYLQDEDYNEDLEPVVVAATKAVELVEKAMVKAGLNVTVR